MEILNRGNMAKRKEHYLGHYCYSEKSEKNMTIRSDTVSGMNEWDEWIKKEGLIGRDFDVILRLRPKEKK